MIHKLAPQTVKRVLLGLVIVISIVLLVLVRGFYYTSYSASHVISAKGDLADTVVNELTGNRGISKVDRENHIVYFQIIPEAEFNKIATQIKEKYKDNKSVEIKTYIENPAPILVVGGNQTMFALAVIFLIYYIYRSSWLKLDKDNRVRVITFLLLSLITGTIVGLGLVSAISLVTMVSEMSVFMVMLAMIIVGLLTILAIAEYSQDQVEKIDDVLLRLTQHYNDKFRLLFPWVVVIVVILCLALGVKIVVDAGIFLFSFFLASQILINWTAVYYNISKFDWRHLANKVNKPKKSKGSLLANAKAQASAKSSSKK